MKKLIFLFVINFFNQQVFALIEIDITRGNLDPLQLLFLLYM